jgi:hypothetical protein
VIDLQEIFALDAGMSKTEGLNDGHEFVGVLVISGNKDVEIAGINVIVYETPAAQALTITYLTLFVFSQWMNSRRSLDSGRIWVLGHDQVKQQLQFFISGQAAVIVIVCIIGFFKGTKFVNYLLHSIRRISQPEGNLQSKGIGLEEVTVHGVHMLAPETKESLALTG